MSKKVIYVSFVRLTDRVSRDWYIDYLISKGVTVEYWDIVSLVREEHNVSGMKTPAYLHIFRTIGELEAMLCLPENIDAYYVMLISCGGRFTKIFRVLSKYNCRMLYIAQGALPALYKPRLHKIFNHLYHPVRLAKIILDHTKTYAFRRLKIVKPFDIIFAAGKVMMEDDKHASRIVPINLCDYDNYLRVKSNAGRIVKGSYAVFLDINLAYQSDLAICNLPAVNPCNYYQSLNRFFGLLEMEYGIKVVIAAHPTADYNKETFQGREIYRLQTAEIVRDADIVITHHSTSLSYAVLNLKPVVFIYTTEMQSLYKETVMRNIRAQAQYLDLPVYNIDEITQGRQVAFKDISIHRYEDYKYSFVTALESEHTITQEIFLREITAG